MYLILKQTIGVSMIDESLCVPYENISIKEKISVHNMI